jgi:hypothetical protein
MGCPAAPAGRCALAAGTAIGLEIVAVGDCLRTRGQVDRRARPRVQGTRAARRRGPATRALSWRGGPGRGLRRPLLLSVQVSTVTATGRDGF